MPRASQPPSMAASAASASSCGAQCAAAWSSATSTPWPSSKRTLARLLAPGETSPEDVAGLKALKLILCGNDSSPSCLPTWDFSLPTSDPCLDGFQASSVALLAAAGAAAAAGPAPLQA